MEREHLFTPNISIVMKVRIGGNPAIDLLKQAIAIAVNANEALNCKIVLLENGFAGYEKLEKLVYSVEISNKSYIEIAREQESKVFKLEKGELIRFFILNGASDIELLIISHHLAGDGLSIVYLLEDIMKALSGNKLEFKPMHIFSVDDLPKKSEMNPIAKMFLKRINLNWRKSGKVFSYADYENMFSTYWHNRKTYIYSVTLSPKELGILCRAAKKSGISLNSLITTAFILAYGKKAEAGLAASIREEGYRGMANFTTGIAFPYKHKENKSFLQNAQAVHKCIYKKLGNDKLKFFVPRFLAFMEATLIDSAGMCAFGKYKNKTAEYFTHLMGYVGNQKDVSISNLTKLDISQKYGEYDLSSLAFVAPIVPYARRVIGIATLGEEICITMHAMDDEKLEKEKDFFNKAIQILRSIQ